MELEETLASYPESPEKSKDQTFGKAWFCRFHFLEDSGLTWELTFWNSCSPENRLVAKVEITGVLKGIFHLEKSSRKTKPA